MRCKFLIDRALSRKDFEISDALIKTLVVAEDHRNALHYGVDPFAILRAFKVRLFEGRRQGASTIEQQLVRTLTGRYEKTPRRKIREQILAVMVASYFTKKQLSRCYLLVAYYGVGLVGVVGLKKLVELNCGCANEAIIAHLKYPRAIVYDGELAARHASRIEHIKLLLATMDNGALHLCEQRY